MPRPPIPGDTELNQNWLERIRNRDLASTGCVTTMQAYDQADDPRIGEQQITRGGWCLGMVMDWLNYRKNGRGLASYWDGFMASGKAREISFPMLAQRYAVPSGGLAASQSTISTLMGRKGFTAEKLIDKQNHGGHGRNLFAECTSKYTIIGLHGRDGAHAIGIFADHAYREFTVLDPNYGEIVIQTEQFAQRWLTAFLTASGYKDSYPAFSIMGFG